MDISRSTFLRSVRSASRSGYVCQRCSFKLQRQQRRGYAVAAKPDLYDVVCVGGGPAGLSLLSALRASPSTANLKIALVDGLDLDSTRSWKLPPDQFSNRCSSLTPASKQLLDEVGAWKYVQHDRIQPFEDMQVWDGVTGARIEFNWDVGARRSGERMIAYMVENLNLTSALLARLDELGGVDVFDKTRVEDIALGEETDEVDLRAWPVLRLSNGKQLGARLLVGADGANSPVRKFASIPSEGWAYDRHGVVATLKLAEDTSLFTDPRVTAYQRFLPSGPIAMLPLPDNHATMVWSTTVSKAALLKSLSTEDLLAMINAAFRLSPVDLNYLHTLPSSQASEFDWRVQHHPQPSPSRSTGKTLPPLATAVQPASVASFPLQLRHATTYIAPRIALVGDAAHTTHPLAGQGLNQGQGDAASLAATIVDAVEHGADIGALLSLERYQSERYATNVALLGAMDALHKLYSFESGPVVGLRSVGLRAVDALGSVKEGLMGAVSGAGRGGLIKGLKDLF